MCLLHPPVEMCVASSLMSAVCVHAQAIEPSQTQTQSQTASQLEGRALGPLVLQLQIQMMMSDAARSRAPWIPPALALVRVAVARVLYALNCISCRLLLRIQAQQGSICVLQLAYAMQG